MNYAEALASAPHLVAHIVRGEITFDIAHRMCEGANSCQPHCGLFPQCKTEDWWIIRSTGHRVYPYWSTSLVPLIIPLEGWTVAPKNHRDFEEPTQPTHSSAPTKRPSLHSLGDLL